MTLVQLEYIIALDNYRHFALAAENCFVTQPTLSMQIQKLEDSLGVLLFDREKHPVEPTAIGRKIIDQARTILDEAKRVNKIVDDEKNEITGEVSLGVIPTLAPYLIPLFISNFLKKYPNVNIQVRELVSKNIVEMLKREDLDLALLVTPISDEALKVLPIFYEDFYVYTSHHHSLFKNDKIEPKTLSTEGLWILNEGHCFRNQTLDICNIQSPRGHRSRIRYESGSLETLKKMVDMQGGFTLLPELVTFDLDKNDLTKLRQFKEPVPSREVSLVLKSGFPKEKLAKALHAEILSSLPATLQSEKKPNIINVSW